MVQRQQITTNNKRIFASVVSLIILILPIITLAKLVTCDGPNCNFSSFVSMINGIINWIISIAGVIFAISAIWGGFLYMTSGTSLGDKEKAKSILWSTLVGFVIILCAWLIVYTILNTLAPGNESILKFIK